MTFLTGGNNAPARDFLSPVTQPKLDSNPLIESLAKDYGGLLHDISFQLRKLNPDILCTTVVQGIGINGSISDTNVHKIWFETSGKPVPIYKLLIFSLNGGIVQLSIEHNPLERDGFTVPEDFTNLKPIPTILNLTTHNLYVRANSAAAPYYVNSPTPLATNPAIWIYGYTAHPYKEF